MAPATAAIHTPKDLPLQPQEGHNSTFSTIPNHFDRRRFFGLLAITKPLNSTAPESSRVCLTLERCISDLVNQAYGLTPEEIDLMWKTAPPRMPFKQP